MAAVLPPILLIRSVPRSRPACPRISPRLSTAPGHWSLPPLCPSQPGSQARELVRSPLAPGVRKGARPGWPLVLAAVLVSVAALVAPERPQDQEAICQRQSGEVACRVW